MHQVAVFERDSAPFQVFLVTGMEASTDDDRLGFGKMGHGCKHYRRRCKVRASCCNGIFSCRHCHDESTKDRHEICRFDVERVAQICSNCGVNMGEYSCGVCGFYDDDIEKAQYQCSDCGICRVGGGETFFHCQKCVDALKAVPLLDFRHTAASKLSSAIWIMKPQFLSS